MSLELVEIGVVRPITGEMLVLAESVEISEYCVALDMARIGYVDMKRVSIHGHDLFMDLFGRLAEIDAVAERLGHLGLSVNSRETEACRVVRKHDVWLYESLAVDGVELADNLDSLLKHRFLVFAYRNCSSLEGADI